MPIVLNRIDDRLIHGQVVLGWCGPWRITRITLVDPEVAASPADQELFRMTVPEGIELRCATVTDAVAHLQEWNADARNTLLLTGSVATMARLHEAVPDVVHDINLGGVHQGPGRVEVLRYLFLSPSERETLQGMEAHGAVISAQDVPTSKPIALEDLW